jgi:hypothetical protein
MLDICCQVGLFDGSGEYRNTMLVPPDENIILKWQGNCIESSTTYQDTAGFLTGNTAENLRDDAIRQFLEDHLNWVGRDLASCMPIITEN